MLSPDKACRGKAVNIIQRVNAANRLSAWSRLLTDIGSLLGPRYCWRYWVHDGIRQGRLARSLRSGRSMPLSTVCSLGGSLAAAIPVFCRPARRRTTTRISASASWTRFRRGAASLGCGRAQCQCLLALSTKDSASSEARLANGAKEWWSKDKGARGGLPLLRNCPQLVASIARSSSLGTRIRSAACTRGAPEAGNHHSSMSSVAALASARMTPGSSSTGWGHPGEGWGMGREDGREVCVGCRCSASVQTLAHSTARLPEESRQRCCESSAGVFAQRQWGQRAMSPVTRHSVAFDW